jgi:tetratricopeptide (TPR) repeat protein
MIMITKHIKNCLVAGLVAFSSVAAFVSCSDMLEVDSKRQLSAPSLNQKTDSVSYAYGVMQAMQQLADQYYFQNEMRGDLVKTTGNASIHLQALSAFTADASNKYDSVYLYYKVINNCNYYLAHRDTTLMTGSQNLVINEYAGIASIRAWTYLQLARQYGSVPYITEPVTTISQINANTSMSDYRTVLLGEAEKLEYLKTHYSEEQLSVPTFNQTSRSVGVLNWDKSINKYISPAKCFIPLNVVLGDIYLELGEYEKAATCYYQYLRYKGSFGSEKISVNYANYLTVAANSERYRVGLVFASSLSPVFKNNEFPVDFNYNENSNLFPESTPSWLNSFAHSAEPGDVISYIPMAVNYTMGKTTDIPAAFGYNYYGTERKNEVQTEGASVFSCPKTQDIQVVPSKAYGDSLRRALYYYYSGDAPIKAKPHNYWIVKGEPYGDARAVVIEQGIGADTSYVYTNKPSTAYIVLYRNATVWLHLAEAINRMGYPDAAFAVLKNGLHAGLSNYRHLEVPLKSKIPGNEQNDSVDASGKVVLNMDESQIGDIYYVTPESWQLLTTTLPFLAQSNSSIFQNTASQKSFVGIHSHGAGAVDYLYSPYRYDIVLGAKIADISNKYSLGLTPGAYTKDDYINAMEDLLCDEYALEFAFEGTRFSDLRRIALHKNQAGTYGGNFGDKWLSTMLQNNAAGITTLNCYLPYK